MATQITSLLQVLTYSILQWLVPVTHHSPKPLCSPDPSKVSTMRSLGPRLIRWVCFTLPPWRIFSWLGLAARDVPSSAILSVSMIFNCGQTEHTSITKVHSKKSTCMVYMYVHVVLYVHVCQIIYYIIGLTQLHSKVAHACTHSHAYPHPHPHTHTHTPRLWPPPGCPGAALCPAGTHSYTGAQPYPPSRSRPGSHTCGLQARGGIIKAGLHVHSIVRVQCKG